MARKIHGSARTEAMLNELKYAKLNKQIALGQKISEMIDILILLDAYEWEPDEIKVFHENRAKYLQAYHMGNILQDDVSAHIDRIKELTGVDLLEDVIIGEDNG